MQKPFLKLREGFNRHVPGSCWLSSSMILPRSLAKSYVFDLGREHGAISLAMGLSRPGGSKAGSRNLRNSDYCLLIWDLQGRTPPGTAKNTGLGSPFLVAVLPEVLFPLHVYPLQFVCVARCVGGTVPIHDDTEPEPLPARQRLRGFVNLVQRSIDYYADSWNETAYSPEENEGHHETFQTSRDVCCCNCFRFD
jgi:hypothetical protein